MLQIILIILSDCFITSLVSLEVVVRIVHELTIKRAFTIRFSDETDRIERMNLRGTSLVRFSSSGLTFLASPRGIGITIAIITP